MTIWACLPLNCQVCFVRKATPALACVLVRTPLKISCFTAILLIHRVFFFLISQLCGGTATCNFNKVVSESELTVRDNLFAILDNM